MKPEKMSESELVTLVDNEFDTSLGRSGQTISVERSRAMDYYMSRELGNEIEGQSKMRTSDVSDVVDAIMPSLLRIFTISENLVNFDPVGQEDVDAAAQESDVVNYCFWKQNPAFMILFSWLWDMLVQKNGVVKAWWDESQVVTTEEYESLTEQELLLLMSDKELEPVEQEERVETITVDMVTPIGIMPRQTQVQVYDVKFRRTTKKGRVKVVPVPPEEYRISKDATSVDPSSARMVGHEREVTRSELVEMDICSKEKVYSLPTSSMTVANSQEKAARLNVNEQNPHANVTTDKSQETVLLREAYIKVDFDGDGISELRQVFVCNQELLSNEEADRQPFHVITGKPIPHKHFGRSVADLVMDIQKVNTTLLRQTLDNLYQTNNPRHGVWEMGLSDNTLDDLLSSQAGSIVRFDRPPNEAYMPMTVPFAAQNSLGMMEYFDKLSRKRTGVHEDSEGLSPEALKNIQQSTMAQALDVSRGKIEAIARIVAETGIKSLMLHIHELLLKHQDREMTVQLRGNFVQVNPTEWRTRTDMTVAIGLGLGSRETKLMHLQGIRDLQAQIAQNGGMGVLLTPQNIWNTCDEYVKNADLKQTERFFTRPDPQETGKDPNADQEAQFKAQLLQIEQGKNELKHQKQMQDAQQSIFELQRKVADQNAAHQIAVEKLKDTFFIEQEKLRNQLTDMELKYSTNIPGSRV